MSSLSIASPGLPVLIVRRDLPIFSPPALTLANGSTAKVIKREKRHAV